MPDEVNKIEKIDKVGKKGGPLEVLPIEPNQDHFESLLGQRRVSSDTTQVAAIDPDQDKVKLNSLFDEVRDLNTKVDQIASLSPEELTTKTKDVIAQIDTLKQKLETPNLEIKGSVQTILRDKLTHIDDNLRMALDKAGIEYKPPEKATTLNSPIERFLGLLTHSQSQLATITSDIQRMAQADKQMSPASMLLVQIKVGHIQQEIELFTSMLNKALESTKTIMNVQV